LRSPPRRLGAAVAAAMTAAVTQHIGGEPRTYVSPIAPRGARVVSNKSRLSSLNSEAEL
jgi:hypothetical protein